MRAQLVTMGEVIEAAAAVFGWTPGDIRGHTRRRPLALHRQIAIAVARDLTGASYPTLALEFGGRDHTTVIHAVKRIEELAAKDEEIADAVNKVANVVLGGPDALHAVDLAPANPWAGREPCPTCGSAEWTLPWDEDDCPGDWRCVACHLRFVVEAVAVA